MSKTKITTLEMYVCMALMVACTGNASATVLDLAGVQNDVLRILSAAAGSFMGAVLSAAAIPRRIDDPPRWLLVAGSFAAGVVLGGGVRQLLGQMLGWQDSHDLLLLAYGMAAFAGWIAVRLLGRSSSKVDDLEDAARMVRRVRGQVDGTAPTRKGGRANG